MYNWPHSPPHRLTEEGVYMITVGTYKKVHLFNTPQKLQMLQNNLLSMSKNYGCELQAWAIFSNHYHFIARSSNNPLSLKKWITIMHQKTATVLNTLDGTSNRRVWHQFWDSRITYYTSYMARLHYVHQNPVKHGIVPVANQYPWCSANFFEKNAHQPFVKTVYSFDYSTVRIFDDF